MAIDDSKPTKFLVKWPVKGFAGGDLQAGDTLESKLSDVRQFVAARHGGEAQSEDFAALIPADALDQLKTEGRYCTVCGSFDSLLAQRSA